MLTSFLICPFDLYLMRPTEYALRLARRCSAFQRVNNLVSLQDDKGLPNGTSKKGKQPGTLLVLCLNSGAVPNQQVIRVALTFLWDVKLPVNIVGYV